MSKIDPKEKSKKCYAERKKAYWKGSKMSEIDPSMSEEKLPRNHPDAKSGKVSWGNAMLEIEGLVWEEISRLKKNEQFYLADYLRQSLETIKRGV